MAEPIEFASSTPRYSLPLLFQGQVQKEFFVNEAHSRVDALLHTAIEGIADAPPSNPDDGECWLVSETPVGDWAGSANMLAAYSSGVWQLILPSDGMRVFDKSADQMRLYTGTWEKPNEPTLPQGGTVVDSEARQAITDLIETLREARILAPNTP